MKKTNVLLKHEEKMSREQVASILESVASKLREKGSFTISLGEKTQVIEPAETVTFEIELEEKNGEYELEFELEWKEGKITSEQLTIE